MESNILVFNLRQRVTQKMIGNGLLIGIIKRFPLGNINVYLWLEESS